MQCELEGTMKKTDIGVVGFMYAVCAFFFLMSRDLKKGARIYPLCIIAILFLLTFTVPKTIKRESNYTIR